MTHYSKELQDNTTTLLKGAEQNAQRISVSLGKGGGLPEAINKTIEGIAGLEENFSCASSSNQSSNLSL